MALMTVVWLATGTGVYLYLSSHRSTLSTAARTPTAPGAAGGSRLSQLPGTLYLVQDGTLYRLQHGRFKSVLQKPEGTAMWSQPAFMPDGQSLVVVKKDYAFSDVYVVDLAGNVRRALTDNSNQTVELNHWAFYPRPSPDGGRVFLSYDPHDQYNRYNVVMAIYAMPVSGTFGDAQQWTSPDHYTGGDVQPLPVPSGAVIFTKYVFDEISARTRGQISISASVDRPPTPLTDPGEDCSQAALSTDGRRLAMTCTNGATASIVVAAFDGFKLTSRQTLVVDQLAAQPTWAPDGRSLIYLAPEGVSGHWQLWQVQVPDVAAPAPPAPTTPAALQKVHAAPPRGVTVANPTPSVKPVSTAALQLPSPVQLTSDLNFDATSTIAWHA